MSLTGHRTFVMQSCLPHERSRKCHFNRPGKTNGRTVKGMLALFCYILTSGLYYSTTCPILSMLLTHTTSGPPAQRPESFPDVLDCQAVHLPCHRAIKVTFPNYTTRKKAVWCIKLIIITIIIIIIMIGMCNQMVTSEIRE